VVYGEWRIVHGVGVGCVLCIMVHAVGVWCMVYGMVCGVWCCMDSVR